MCNELVQNVSAIDTSGFVLKTQYGPGKSGQEKIPDTSGLVKKQIMVIQ